MAYNKIDWTKNLTTDPAYGAVPTVTISDNTGFGYTVGGLNGATGSNAMWTTTSTGTSSGSFRISPDYNTTAATIEQSGKMTLRGKNADLDINGKSLKDWMERVEERLNILTPNPELEKEWDDLRRLGERYRKLEKKCKEKAEVWNKLKSMPKPETKW
jgi:hypothetical protein